MLTEKSHWYLIVVCGISNIVTCVSIEPKTVIKKKNCGKCKKPTKKSRKTKY